MNLITLIVAIPAGLTGGMVFYGGLWASVVRLRQRSQPATWMLASWLLRFASAGLVFFSLARYGGLWALIAGLAGFFAVRFYLLRRLSPRGALQTLTAEFKNHD